MSVTSRGLMTAAPAFVSIGDESELMPVDAWAGPWPIDELWWDPAQARRLRGFRSPASTAVPGCWSSRTTSGGRKPVMTKSTVSRILRASVSRAAVLSERTCFRPRAPTK